MDGVPTPPKRDGLPSKQYAQAAANFRKHARRELKALLATAREAALNFSEAKRELIRRRWADGWRVDAVTGKLTPPDPQASPPRRVKIPDHVLDGLQPLMEEYDPVIQLVVVAADWENTPELRLRANGLAAEYMHPKLKSIELTTDDDTKDALDQRNEIAGRMVEILEAMAQARREANAKPVGAPTIDNQPNGHAEPNGHANGHDANGDAIRREIEGDDDDDEPSDLV